MINNINPSIYGGFTIHCNPQSVSIIYSDSENHTNQITCLKKKLANQTPGIGVWLPVSSYWGQQIYYKKFDKMSGVGSRWKCLDFVFNAGKCLKSNNSYWFINYWYTYCTKLYFNGLKAVLTTIYMCQMHGLMDTLPGPSILLL